MPASVPFPEKLHQATAESGSLLCVGIDPDPDRLPETSGAASDPIAATRKFCVQIIKATAPYASCFKVNFAFFEAMGPAGWMLLKEVSDEIPASKIRIADAKRGDIGNTGRFYARAVFEQLPFDACTVSPYMGQSSVAPFLQYPDKAAFVLGRTSNPDADQVQLWPSTSDPLYRHIASRAREWGDGSPGTVGLVAGATDVNSLGQLRAACPEMPFLVPGVGAQGGDLKAVLRAGHTSDGPVIVNSSRSILYASPGSDYAEAAAAAASDLRRRMRHALAEQV